MLSVDIDLLWTVINILLLCVLVRVFLLKPIHRILDERQSMVDENLKAAETAKAEAEALAQQQRDAMDNIDAEKAKAMEEATRSGMTVYEGIVDEAKVKAAQIVKNAEIEAEQQKKQIMREAQSEIRSMVLEATARVVGVRTGSDSAIYDQFLEKAGDSDDESNS